MLRFKKIISILVFVLLFGCMICGCENKKNEEKTINKTNIEEYFLEVDEIRYTVPFVFNDLAAVGFDLGSYQEITLEKDEIRLVEIIKDGISYQMNIVNRNDTNTNALECLVFSVNVVSWGNQMVSSSIYKDVTCATTEKTLRECIESYNFIMNEVSSGIHTYIIRNLPEDMGSYNTIIDTSGHVMALGVANTNYDKIYNVVKIEEEFIVEATVGEEKNKEENMQDDVIEENIENKDIVNEDETFVVGNEGIESENKPPRELKTLYSGNKIPEEFLKTIGLDDSFNDWMINDGSYEFIHNLFDIKYRRNRRGQAVDGAYEENAAYCIWYTNNNDIVDDLREAHWVYFDFDECEDPNFNSISVYLINTEEGVKVKSIKFSPIIKRTGKEQTQEEYKKSLEIFVEADILMTVSEEESKYGETHKLNTDEEMLNRILQSYSKEELEEISGYTCFLKEIKRTISEEEIGYYSIEYSTFTANYSLEEPAYITGRSSGLIKLK